MIRQGRRWQPDRARGLGGWRVCRAVVSPATQWSDVDAADLCARLACALVWFLELRGFWQSALRYTQRALDAIRHSSLSERAGTEAPPLPIIHHVSRSTFHASLLYHQASLHHDLGDLPAARQRAEGSLTIFRQLNDDAGAAQSLNLLGLIARREGKPEEAQAHFEESLRLRRAFGDAVRSAVCLTNLGLLADERGDPDTARQLYEESLALWQEAGDQRNIAELKNNMGVLAFKQSDFVEAGHCYTDALRVERTLGNKLGIARALFNLGEVAEAQSDADRAARCFSAAYRLFTELGSPWATYSADALMRLGQAAEMVSLDEVVEVVLEG